MSPKASADFGLYKEKLKENNLRSIKVVLLMLVAVLFLMVTLYALAHLVGKTGIENLESTLERPNARAEKLVSETVKREVYQNAPPKPFGLTFKGQPPQEFTPTTEKTYRQQPQKYYPHNIQEVIGYSSRFHHPMQGTHVKFIKQYQQSSSEYVPQNKGTIKFSENDPFYLYKPQDPGDINLLAVGNVRFAPPPWSNTHTGPKLPFYQGNIKRQESFNEEKPVVTLNVFPKEYQQYESRGGLKQLLYNKIEYLQQKLKFPDGKPRKMILHVNLYPDDFGGSESKISSKIQGTTQMSTFN